MPNWLAGYKTYIVGWLLVLKGVIGFVLPDSGISADPAGDIQLGLLGLGIRKAIN